MTLLPKVIIRRSLASIHLSLPAHGPFLELLNLNLIEAASPDEAYEKSIALGRAGESAYENAAGKLVRVVFRGLRDLFVIYEDLEDGAEILYEEKVGVPEDQLRTMVKERNALGVFAPIEDWSTTAGKPILLSADGAKLLLKHFEGLPDDPH